MTEFLPLERYIEFLKKIDIGYFANNRQQAAGNMTKLLGFGKKVYAPQNLTHIQWLRSLGVFIYDYDKFSPSRIDDEISNRNHSILKSKLSFAMLKQDLIACLKA
jgi:hypothetical protein